MLDQILHSFRLLDLIDVALLAVFLFFILTWLRRSMSRNALVAVLLFAAVYIPARVLQLYMIEAVLRGTLVFLLLAAVIVFQADIRRMVEHVGQWVSGREARKADSSPMVDLLVEAAAHLAQHYTGALIAIRGHESWDRLIDGGVEQGGRVSLPLLYSLFNAASPGHDGAVLMEGSRILKFGAHLPLSTNLSEVGDHGTRHTAALGLAERCDAFVIVVSEENGTISAAENGRLHTMTAAELAQRLTAFWQHHYDQQATTKTAFAWWNRRNMQTALGALSLAVICWLLFVYDPGTVFRTTTPVPIELRNVPEDWAIEEPIPAEVRVTLSGSETGFQQFDPSALLVSLDLSDIERGQNVFAVDAQTLNLPTGIDLYDVEPSEVEVTAQRLHTVSVPVELSTSGTLPDSLELVALRADPDTVSVMVPEGTQPERVRTEPVDLSSIDGPTTLRTNLVLPAGGRLPAGDSPEVDVTVQTRLREEPYVPQY